VRSTFPPSRVFDFLDYRAFLADYYATKKAEGRGFSYRAFARRVGVRAPNHLKLIVDGQRNLSATMARKYADAIGLKGDHAEYFCDLVLFNQAKTAADKNAAYERLSGSRGYRRAQRLDLVHAAYHAEWYIPAIREMAARPDFRDDPSWIAERMIPRITPANASHALEILFSLGLLEKKGARIKQRETVVTTGAQTAGLHIANYHRAMLHRADASIDLVPAAERDISSITFFAGEDGLRRIKERLQRFRQELLAIMSEEDEADHVLQLGIQLFPLTSRRSEER